MANLVQHFEIHASDPPVLIDFYSELLGWRFTRFGDMDYWAIETGEGSIPVRGEGRGINGGLTRRRGPRPEPGAPVVGANLVVGVDGSVDDLVRRALDLGATEAVPLTDMPGVGRLAYLLDPDGNVFGLLSVVLSDGTNVLEGT